ncbi:MAG TPA: hypothetical protein VK897_26460 [Anaerolineales bacterium]|nr:hypothetical protein [Anaerolineales bacterium]
MINFYFADFAKLVLAFFLALSQSPAKTAEAHVATLKAGDEIDGMVLTSGAKDDPPIWAFCSTEESKGMTSASCWVPQMSALAIGHVFLPGDHAFAQMEWSDLEWELYLDDRLIQLEDFDTYSYIVPTVTSDLSPVREVLTKALAWDVVLTNLRPGEHTIEGRVQAGAEEYRWIINLVIEAKPAPYWKSVPKYADRGVTSSECFHGGQSLSRFHGGCRVYG